MVLSTLLQHSFLVAHFGHSRSSLSSCWLKSIICVLDSGNLSNRASLSRRVFGSCEATDSYQISLKLVGFFRGVFGSFLKDSFLVVKQSVRFFRSFRAVSTPR